MACVVVIGAGLGGLPAAYELRHRLPRQHQVMLISNQPKFTFQSAGGTREVTNFGGDLQSRAECAGNLRSHRAAPGQCFQTPEVDEGDRSGGLSSGGSLAVLPGD